MPQVRPVALQRLASRIFEAVGTPPDIADSIAEVMIENHLAGHDSHGILRISPYLEWIRRGRIVPTARPEILNQGATTALIRGHKGFGQPAALLATELAVDMALTSDTAAVSVVETGHTGRLAAFTDRAARQGVAMFMTVGTGGPPMTVPFGGAVPSLGTNPIAFSIPRGHKDPVSLDYATSAIANGKLLHASAQRRHVPENCIVARDGSPTTDPEDYFDGGHLLPFGGHKGYALAVIADLLSGAMTGADQYHGSAMDTGLFLFAVSESAFRPREDYVNAIDRLAERITSVPTAPGFNEVLLPGDPENRARNERQRAGIPVSDETWREVSEIAGGLGLDAEELAELSLG